MNNPHFRKNIYLLLLAAVVVFAGSCSGSAAKKAAAAAESKKAEEGKVFTCTSQGRWFPVDPDELRKMVDGYLSKAEKKEIKGRIVALISPHAGYQFSGPVAAYSYKQLEGRKYDTVVVVGFSHSVYAPNIAVFPKGKFRTPLGDIPIDEKAAAALMKATSRVVVNEQIFSGEHSVDNQLPFLQRTLKNFKLLPVMFGSQTDENIKILGTALASALKGKNVLIVASTDMSHFWEYDDANKLDKEMVGKIESYDIEGVAKLMEGDRSGRRMCGYGDVQAVMLAARALGADKVEILKSENSQDTFGSTGQGVVGYLAAALVDANPKNNPKIAEISEKNTKKEPGMDEKKVSGELNKEDKKEMLKIARESLESYIATGKKIKVTTSSPGLQGKNGMFVTLDIRGALRGCMGHFEADTPVGELAASQIIVSATEDPRFPPVSKDELKDIDIEISVLSVPQPVDSYKDIIVGKHGVIMQKRGRGATFLPQVAPEQGWDRDTMLANLSMKAGLSPDAWKEGAQFLVYTAQVFGEKELEK